MILRGLMIAAGFVAAAASAQTYDPYGYPPAPPPPGPHPQQPGQFPPQGPMLAIPVLEADLRAKAGSDTVRFARDSYVLTPQAQATLTAQAQWLIQRPFVQASIEGHADGRQSRDYAFALGERRASSTKAMCPACSAPMVGTSARLLPPARSATNATGSWLASRIDCKDSDPSVNG